MLCRCLLFSLPAAERQGTSPLNSWDKVRWTSPSWVSLPGQAQHSRSVPSRRYLCPRATVAGSLLFITPLALGNLHPFLYRGKLRQEGWVSSTSVLSLVVGGALQAGGFYIWQGEHWIQGSQFQGKKKTDYKRKKLYAFSPPKLSSSI